jgi:hypothetical protein
MHLEYVHIERSDLVLSGACFPGLWNFELGLLWTPHTDYVARAYENENQLENLGVTKMIRKALITAAAGIALVAVGSLAPSRTNAMPLGIPTDAVNQVNLTEAVALCFYIDGWNGPGMYQCGYRMRRGYGWHGPRHGGGRVVVHEGRRHGGSAHHGAGKHGTGKHRH